MAPGCFLVTFGHMNTLQKELNHFMVGKSRTWHPLKVIAPFITRKKIRSVYKVYGTQNDRLELTVSTQKSVLKNMHRVPRYYQKSVENRPSKPNQQNLTHFGRYLGTQCIFFKTDFCVETVSPSRSI